MKLTTLLLTISTNISKIDEILRKNSGKVNKNYANRSNILKNLNLDNSL